MHDDDAGTSSGPGSLDQKAAHALAAADEADVVNGNRAEVLDYAAVDKPEWPRPVVPEGRLG
jgi:hypothetical protein